MNLVSDPWIPVVLLDKTPRLVSLNEVFRDGETIADLAANPCQRIALMRLLICIAQAALDGPKDEEDWLACRSRLADAAQAYLEKWQHRFNLFGEHAFLQVDGLSPAKNKDEGKEKNSDKLDITLAAGNAHTLFDAEARSENDSREFVTPADIALNLLTVQSFSLGGGQSPSVMWNGVLIDGSENPRDNGKINNNFTAGALSNRRAYTYVRGNDVLASVHLNLLTKTDVKTYMPSSEWGIPLWESFPTSYHGEHVARLRSAYLQNLTPLTRICKLAEKHPFNLSVYTNGYAYPDDLACYREPSASVYRDKEGNNQVVMLEEGRHPWRDLASILELNQKSGALCVKHLHDLPSGDKDQAIDIWVGGMISNQAKIIDMAEWSACLTVNSLGLLNASFYRERIQEAEVCESTLCAAMTAYFEWCGEQLFQKNKNGQFAHSDKRCRSMREKTWANAKVIFWTCLDGYVLTLVELSEQHEVAGVKQWIKIIRTALHTAYERTCPHETPRQIQAYAQGLKILDSWKEQ